MVDFKTLIINLKILGKLNTGIKLNTRGKFFELDDINWYQGISRFYRKDDRNVTYEKISILIRDLSDLINNSNNIVNNTVSDKKNEINRAGFESREEFNVYIKPIIDDAIKGLSTLKVTYETDETFIAQIELELDTLTRLSLSIGPITNEETTEI